MKKGLMLVSLVLFILFMNLGFAESDFTFKKNNAVDLKVPCFNLDNSPCTVDTNCTLLINYPNGVNVIQNVTMSYSVSYYNYSIGVNVFNQTGIYPSNINCIGNTTNGFKPFEIEITSSGKSVKDASGLGIVIFILIVAGGLFMISLRKKFVENKYTNLVIKRAFVLLGIYLMILNSTIMATIAEASNLDLTSEMFTYMTIFGYAGYMMMLFFVFKTMVDMLVQYKQDKQNERTGNDND